MSETRILSRFLLPFASELSVLSVAGCCRFAECRKIYAHPSTPVPPRGACKVGRIFLRWRYETPSGKKGRTQLGPIGQAGVFGPREEYSSGLSGGGRAFGGALAAGLFVRVRQVAYL